MRASVSYSIFPRYSCAYLILLIAIFGFGASIGIFLGLSHWFELEGKKLEFETEGAQGIECVKTPNTTLLFKSWCDTSYEVFMQDQALREKGTYQEKRCTLS